MTIRRFRRLAAHIRKDGFAATVDLTARWLRGRTIDRVRRLPLYFDELGIEESLDLLFHWIHGDAEIEVHPRRLKAPITVRRNDSDIYVLRDAIVVRDSDPDLEFTPKFIIDGGANIGYTTALFASKYPDATIVAVEPDPTTARILTKHCAAYPNVHVIEAAIWKSSGTVCLHAQPGESWATQVSDGPNGTVRAVTIEGLMDQFGASGVDLLKLDVEGAEREIFAGDTEWMARVRVLVVELHGDDATKTVLGAMARYPFRSTRKGEKVIFVREAAVGTPN